LNTRSPKIGFSDCELAISEVNTAGLRLLTISVDGFGGSVLVKELEEGLVGVDAAAIIAFLVGAEYSEEGCDLHIHSVQSGQRKWLPF
jgi:hypothetical protein